MNGATFADPNWPDTSAPIDPFGLGYPCTHHPGWSSAHGSIVVANRGYYLRVAGSGTISKLGVDIGVSSGNISAAVYRNLGAGRAAVPTGAAVATTGAIASPGTGYRELALGASVYVAHGDWFFLSCDNTTATFRELAGGAVDSNLALGSCFWQASAHPAPTVGTITAGLGRPFTIVGVA